MTKARSIDGAARLIAAGLGILGPRNVAVAEPKCHPSAVVAGGREVVDQVIFELATRGIDVMPAISCPTLHVNLVRRDGQIILQMTDPAGRAMERTVARVGEAATLIESWARPDVTADLLAGFEILPSAVAAPPPPEPVVIPASSPVIERLEPIASTRTATALPRRSPLTFEVLGDFAVDRRSSWVGVSVTTCVPLGGICVGVTGHARTSSNADQAAERSVLFSVDVPVRLGRLTVLPGVGIGAGRDVTLGDGAEMDIVSWTPRGEARLTASYPITGSVAFDLGVGVVVASSTAEDSNQMGNNTSSTGPTAWFQLGAGLRLGAP